MRSRYVGVGVNNIERVGRNWVGFGVGDGVVMEQSLG